MRNLVLGSSGFIGTYLCQFLRDKGEEVVEYDIKNTPDNNYDITGPWSSAYESQDLRKGLLNLKNIDRVYFLAWKIGGSHYLNDPATQKEQLDWNTEMVLNVMPQLANIPYVFASTQLATQVDTAYGVVKRLAEVYTKQSQDGVNLRLWNVYGAWELESDTNHAVTAFVHRALRTGTIDLQTTGEELRQFIHVEDVCKALYSSFGAMRAGTYDVCPNVYHSILQVAQEISRVTGCTITKGELVRQPLDLQLVNTMSGWSPKIELPEGIERTVALYKSMKVQDQLIMHDPDVGLYYSKEELQHDKIKSRIRNRY